MSLLTTNVNFANLLHKNTANYALKIPHLLPSPWVGNPFPARGWEIPFPPFGARPNAWIEVRLLGFTLYLHKTVLWKSRISRDIEQVLGLKFRF